MYVFALALFLSVHLDFRLLHIASSFFLRNLHLSTFAFRNIRNQHETNSFCFLQELLTSKIEWNKHFALNTIPYMLAQLTLPDHMRQVLSDSGLMQ